MRIASIDIGTNAVKAKIFDTSATLIKFVKSLRSPIRLGHEVFIEGKIPDKKLNQLLSILDEYLQIFEKENVMEYEIIATCAFRDTSNAEEARRFIEHSIEHPIRIISGLEEAKLMRFHPKSEKNSSNLFVDLGGGSTELFMKNNGKVLISSFNLGAVRNMLNADNKNEWNRLKKFIKKLPTPKKIIGIGGNIRSFIDAHKVQVMSAKQFNLAVSELEKLDFNQKIALYGFSNDRADVIDHAMQIFKFILTQSECKKIQATKWGVSDSIAVKMFHEMYSKKIKIIS
ncbi:MAG: phosphatase [Gammaproteobacteria bacterium]